MASHKTRDHFRFPFIPQYCSQKSDSDVLINNLDVDSNEDSVKKGCNISLFQIWLIPEFFHLRR